ncbi:hypothetical protein CBOM_06667 [Ceraceosorus bombacis]|uniref:CUE domain-containing protein n=1 Tax=Ceraceosorus bombacis TaxID=401625 RepID=A0A0P1BS30_9BASI|nr:hypothetical protein CBOM_06667 [Ceraceosorus bombacis]
MAEAQLGSARFLLSLSSLRPAAIPSLLNSSPQLPAALTNTLAWLAAQSIDFGSQRRPQGQEAVLISQDVGNSSYEFVHLLVRVLHEGDPTLIRMLLPQATTLLHLLTVVHLAPHSGHARSIKGRKLALSGLRAIFRRTLTPEEIAHLVRAAIDGLHDDESCGSAAACLSALLRVISSKALPNDEWGKMSLEIQTAAQRIYAPSNQAGGSAEHDWSASTKALNIHLQDAAALLAALRGEPIKIDGDATIKHRQELTTLGHGLAQSIQRPGTLPVRPHASTLEAASQSSPETSSERVQLDALLNVLPHISRSNLLGKLRSDPRYAARSNEQIIELLLDDPDGAQTAASPRSASHIALPPGAESISPPRVAKKPISPLRESRARFNFDPSRFLNRDGNRSSSEQGLSEELKRLTIARAEAPSSDESDVDDFGVARDRAVGFEEELETETEQPQDRRRGISKLFGMGANASRFAEDYSTFDEDTEAEDEDNEDHETRAPAGAAAVNTAGRQIVGSSNKGKAAVSDATALQLHYLHHGANAFAGSDANRSSKQRRDLLASLGGSWDHALVEDWATVFTRDPKREKMLSRLSTSNTASIPAVASRPDEDSEDEDQSTRFGPDRGRGGRVLRGASGGGRGRGGSGPRGGSEGGGGKSSRGRGTGHSGTDRGAKRKERQGNVARTRGHDRKMNQAGGGGGFA